MFIGSYTYSVDAKGRISIPAKYKKCLNQEANDTFIMTRGTVQCIDLYPSDYWLKIMKLLARIITKVLSLFDHRSISFIKYNFNFA